MRFFLKNCLWLALASVSFLFGAPAAHADVRIVTTIADFGSIAKEIGGAHVEVTSLVRPTQDPHFLDAKPSFIVALNRADMVVVAGMELEAGWLPSLLTGARNGRIQPGTAGYLDCATLIAPMEVERVDRAKGDVHPGGNPHYWTDPRNGLRLARGIGARLERIDPAHAAAYRKGTEAFVGRLRARIQAWQSMLSPLRHTKVVVYHRSWVYFLDFAGFLEVGALEPKPGIPPSPDHVAALMQRVKDQRVRFVIQESFYPTRLSQLFAQKTGAKLKVLPTMVGAQGTRSYIDLIDTIVRTLIASSDRSP